MAAALLRLKKETATNIVLDAEVEKGEAGKTPGGRFCNVFEFRDNLIARVHVYLDPDYVSEDEPRFRWGREGRTW